MSGEPSDEEMQRLREERMEQLREQAEQQEGEGGGREAAQQRAEAQKKAVLRKHLTDDARKRLNTLKMSKPEVAEQVESQLVAIAQSGRIQGKIDDEKMAELLRELTPDSKSFDIKRR
ncbi:DNA-binding protein [Halorhabdus rudnickae]|uniref:DNA-binding protein n=1 Tax=Halorhabdus rudnickae TaxID=1775544 RepID=UPI0010824DD3|nr:DNA-binding protein [Halorhabdus rudnickae]